MRQSLERLGGRSPERSGFALPVRPRRHGFVQDGQVVVEQARRRPRFDSQPAVADQPGENLAAKLERAERALHEARAQAHASETRLGHTELELRDAAGRARDGEQAIAQLRGELATRLAELDDLRAELEKTRRLTERRPARPDVAEPESAEPEPVKWWLGAKSR